MALSLLLLRPPIILAIAVIVGVFLYLVRRSRKRKALEKRTKLNGIGK